ncbi:MAG: CoA-transferase [Anaerolineae bacterium]|jgi:3-oxoacid CoA-transferase subunit A/glutaconate CoA-transferase subunit A
MDVLEQGQGELIGWHDPDEHRAWVAEHKSRALKDKRTSIEKAVAKYVEDGDLIASGGFGHIRISMASIYEIIRQRKTNLTMCGKTAVHDSDLLIAAGCVTRIEVAYAFGHELRGLSPASRRAAESGRCEVVADISNAAYQWRFLAAAMGLPSIPTRVMLGTDTLKRSSAKVVEDPFSGKPICMVPACYPDVVLMHVHRCDKYGNAQIDGIIVEDFELARAARRLILTTERVVDDDVIRESPQDTKIPYYLVDAVVEVPYGAHPTLMPGQYYFDEAHIGEWLKLSKTDDGVAAYLDRYVHAVDDFAAYLNLIGGADRLERLRQVEHLEAPLEAPWLEEKRG